MSDTVGKGKSDFVKTDANDEILLAQLRQILLRKDREQLAELEDELNDPNKLGAKISPIIEYHLSVLRQKFPAEYKKEVEKLIERRLKESQDELLDVIYPVIGKMIRKYVNLQFQTLKDSIDNRVKGILSPRGIWGRIKALVTGVNESEYVLSGMQGPMIEEVYVIERDSGLLQAHYSRNATIDRDVVAGMLTAIKSFVEDAFNREREDLEMIEYGTYKIYIQSFHLYYISIVISGTLSSSERDKLSAKILDFAEEEIQSRRFMQSQGEDSVQKLSDKLAVYFKTEQEE